MGDYGDGIHAIALHASHYIALQNHSCGIIIFCQFAATIAFSHFTLKEQNTMKRMQKIIVSIAAFSALGLMAETTLAQPGGWGMGMMGGPENCPYEQGSRGMMRGKMQGRMAATDFSAAAAARLDKFKTDLKITPAQDAAWQAFAGKAKQQVESMQAMHQQQPPAGNTAVSAPERMDKGIEFMKQQLANMETMNAALKDLYAVLTPEQKAIADQHFNQHSGPQNRQKRMMRNAPVAAPAPAATK